MRVESYKCDVCKSTKGEGNRWLMGKIMRVSSQLSFVGISPWNDGMAKTYTHFCSDTCALTWQQRQIDKMGR